MTLTEVEIEYRLMMETGMKFAILISLAIIVGCAPRPTLDQLEEEALVSGEWTTVEKREELVKKRLESTAPGCPIGHSKKCIEEQSGIQCYCRLSTDERN